MKTKETILSNEKLTIKETEKQKKLATRKRIEDYIAEKQLEKEISDFDYRL